MNGESVSLPVFTQCANIKQLYCKQLKTKQLDEMSAKVS